MQTKHRTYLADRSLGTLKFQDTECYSNINLCQLKWRTNECGKRKYLNKSLTRLWGAVILRFNFDWFAGVCHQVFVNCNLYYIEPQYNEPLCNEGLNVMNDILQPRQVIIKCSVKNLACIANVSVRKQKIIYL